MLNPCPKTFVPPAAAMLTTTPERLPPASADAITTPQCHTHSLGQLLMLGPHLICRARPLHAPRRGCTAAAAAADITQGRQRRKA